MMKKLIFLAIACNIGCNNTATANKVIIKNQTKTAAHVSFNFYDKEQTNPTTLNPKDRVFEHGNVSSLTITIGKRAFKVMIPNEFRYHMQQYKGQLRQTELKIEGKDSNFRIDVETDRPKSRGFQVLKKQNNQWIQVKHIT